jgi:hypothetical protein
MGYFQEVVTSWFNPCDGLPAKYIISAYDSGLGDFVALTTVSTTTCISQASGGPGAAAFCVTYLPNYAVTDKVQISYSDSDLPDISDGANLYEIAVQGIFLGIICNALLLIL